MIVEKDIIQGSDEWFSAKLGKPSSSNFGKIVTATGKKSAQWNAYAYKLAAEIRTGKHEESYSNQNMENGLLLEDGARQSYSFIKGVDIIEVGLVYPNENKAYSCSPDGLEIDFKSGLEIKNPIASTQMKYLHKKVLPNDYKPQVYGSLYICDEVEFWDFFSHHEDLNPFMIRVTRDDEGYKKYVEALDKYLPEFIKQVKHIAEA